MSSSTNKKPQKRPVRLELNNSGAWKTLMTFDATDEETTIEVHRLAHEIGSLNARLGGRMKWRISMPHQHDLLTSLQTLREWSPETGWRDA